MKNVYLKIGLLLAALLAGSNGVLASGLPSCPSSGYLHNCFGTWYDGTGYKYVGEWKNNKQHGQGTGTFSAPNKNAGYKYVGDYRDGKKNGQGTESFSAPHKSAGYKYIGEYRDDKKNGQGTGTFSAPHKSAGYKYVGEYRDDKRNGQGIATWSAPHRSAGSKYVGEFRDDKRNGQGTYTYPSGEIEEGVWKDGELQYAEKRSENASSSSGNSKLNKHKEFCEEIGFTPGSEKFAECVMVLIDTD